MTVRRRDDPAPRGPMDRFGGERQKRRFVHDGEVPVVVLGGPNPAAAANGTNPTNRLAVAEAALDSERVARRRAERALSDAQTLAHDLETKIGHANLARDEALEQVRQLRSEIQRLEELLESERMGRAEAEQALQAARERRRKPAPAPVIQRRKPRVKEPKPVKWW
jgi:hypothetical protein